MGLCAGCGHPLGVGRFCTNCGRRAGEHPSTAETTAEPAAVPPPPEPPASPGSRSLPPPTVQPPPQARYPLFAEEAPVADATLTGPAASTAPDAAYAARRAARARGGWLPWVIGAAALVLVALVGTLLLVTGDTPEDTAGEPGAGSAGSAGSAGTGAGGSGSAGSEPAPAPPGSPEGTEPSRRPSPAPSRRADRATDLARYATVQVPATAPPNEDVSGNLVRYEAENMLDGVPETCWRMPGSGAGGDVVLAFRAPVVLTRVGLVNGYAKTSGGFDWYHGNRRVLSAEWVFDDGTVVQQSFGDTRRLQSLSIPPVTTTSVTLRLVEASDPGRGRSARDYTALSDVSLVGRPA